MGLPRVLVLTSTFPARTDDGTPAFVADLANELGQDFHVRILAPAVPGGAAREQLSARVDVVRYRYFPRRWEDLADGAILENVRSRRSRLLQVPFLLLGLARAIRRETKLLRPDLIHAHWIIPQGIVAHRVARATPMVVTTLGGDLYALNSPFARRLKRSVLSHAAAVTVMNAEMRDKAVELGAEPATTIVLPMGAKLSRFSPRDAPAARPDEPLRLLAVGRLVEKKGFDVLLQALASMETAYTLEIVGDGPERERLETAARGMPVHFSGQLGRDDLAARYRTADIAVFPSRRAASGDQDGLPVAMLEAMGSGCAVIASDLPGLNEAIQDGLSGMLVPEADAAALTRALTTLASDPAQRRRLSEAAQRRALEYAVPAIGARYRDLFQGIISAARG